MLNPGLLAATSGEASSVALVFTLFFIGSIFGRRYCRYLGHYIVGRKHRTIAERINPRLEAIGATTYFKIGTVVAGLPGADSMQVFCAANSEELVFLPALIIKRNPGKTTEELGRIRRDSVEALDVTETTKSHIHKIKHPFNIINVLLFIPRLFITPIHIRPQHTKNMPVFLLNIRWTDTNGFPQNTVFEFANGANANRAEDDIRQLLTPNIQNTSQDLQENI